MPANTNPIIQSPNFPYPIQKNDQGGFDILLRKRPLSQPAITDPAAGTAPASNMPPAMTDESGLDAGAGDFIGNMPRPRPEDGAPAQGVGDVIDSVFGSGGESTTGTHDAAPPDMGGGPLSKLLPGGWGDTIASAVGGMQNIDRNQSPIAAFASGMGGAMTTRENRRKSKREEMLSDEDRQIAAEERSYRHGRDTIEDQRAAKRDVWAEHADQRAAAAEERAGRAADWSELESAMNLDAGAMKLAKAKADDLADKFGMSAAEQTTADKAVEDEMTAIVGKDNDAFVVSSYDDDAAVKAKTDRYLTLKHQLQQQEYAKYYKGPQQPGAAGAPAVDAGTGASVDNPIKWTPATAPKSEAEFTAQLDAAVAANGGNPVTFIHPGTGKPRLYRGHGSPVAAAP